MEPLMDLVHGPPLWTIPIVEGEFLQRSNEF